MLCGSSGPKREFQRIAWCECPGSRGFLVQLCWHAFEIKGLIGGKLQRLWLAREAMTCRLFSPVVLDIVTSQEYGNYDVGRPEDIHGGNTGESVLLKGLEARLRPRVGRTIAANFEGQLEAELLWALEDTLVRIQGVGIFAGDQLGTAVSDSPEEAAAYAVGGNEGLRADKGLGVDRSNSSVVEGNENLYSERRICLSGSSEAVAAFLDERRQQVHAWLRGVRVGVGVEYVKLIDVVELLAQGLGERVNPRARGV